ncbi:MAG: methyltransferase domain-containing protein [Luteitalea sp.]|nr:methyltransferase domain-containing protein [Luteitalea sp.]
MVTSLFRLFLISFLVLFLEVTLIRWVPAYVRLLSYFANFILLASFLGIGIGCLVARVRWDLFRAFAVIQAAVVAAVYFLRFEVTVPVTSSHIYFSSGTSEQVVPVGTTYFLPLLFIVVAVLFVTLAQRLGREMERHAPLRAYLTNLTASLAAVGAFALMSYWQLPPAVWFGVALVVSLPFVWDMPRGWAVASTLLLAVSLGLVVKLQIGTIWSPYYKITTYDENGEMVVEVNNIFHQSMAPISHKEYFYEWPYTVLGDGLEDVLILGAGSGTDVAAALEHGVTRVDAVEIDPVIASLGQQHHPDRPYQDPRVHVVTDDARHFLRTTDRQYDLVVFALIDSLTLQSSFTSVRLESYMFTEESFRAVRRLLKPDGVLVIYNYFREKWLVDRLANTAERAFGEPPRVHVHEEFAYLAVMMAGPGLARVGTFPPVPDRVAAYNQPDVVSPGRPLARDTSVVPASDDWPFLYMQAPTLPAHYSWALALVLGFSVISVSGALRWARAAGNPGHVSPPTLSPFAPQFWVFFLLGVGFMLLETKSIIQFALLWGSTWVVASLAIASVLVMAVAATVTMTRYDLRRRWLVGACLLLLIGLSYLWPIGSIGFASRTAESIFYALLVFSPLYCAGLLFGASLKRTNAVSAAYGANLLGAMLGGVTEYVSLVTGYRFLLLIMAVCYVGALLLGAGRGPSERDKVTG